MNNAIDKNIKFQQISSKTVEEILNLAKSQNFEVTNLFKKFLSEFYLLLPVEKLRSDDTQSLLDLAINCFMRYKKVNLELPIVNIINQEEVRYSAIEIIVHEAPFIINSIKKELIKKEIKIYEIIHPIYHVNRDEKGQLLEIFEDKSKAKTSESFIRLHTSRINNKDKIDLLTKSLSDILQNVSFAVNDHAEMLEYLEQISNYVDEKSVEKNMLSWLKDSNFTFLASAQYIENSLIKKLGIFKIEEILINDLINKEVLQLSDKISRSKVSETFLITKIKQVSPIHRHSYLDCIILKQENSLKIFLGLFTTSLYYQKVKSIPVIKEKVEYVNAKTNFPEKSYSAKEILNILDSLPKEELFQIPQEEIYTLALSIYSLLTNPEVKFYLRKNEFNETLSCFVFIPSHRFSPDLKAKILDLLVSHLGQAQIVAAYTKEISLPIVCVYIMIESKNDIKELDIDLIEKKLRKISSLWREDFKAMLLENIDAEEAIKTYYRYKESFPESYKEKIPVDRSILSDIQSIEKAILSNIPVFDLSNPKDSIISDTYDLKIYSYDRKILLSDMMPVFDNMGFAVEDVNIYEIFVGNERLKLWLQHYRLNIRSYHTKPISELKEYELMETQTIKHHIEEALEQIWLGNMFNNGLNKLIIRAGLRWREISILRVFSKYIAQIGFTYSIQYTQTIIANHPRLAMLMFELFDAKFNPYRDQSKPNLDYINDDIKKRLSEVSNNVEDKILRKFFEVINAIVRTNFYQKDENGNEKLYFSFKIDSGKLTEMPKPVPFKEIFVHDAKMSGIHLRGGKVARGGIRWSDRTEDYRTEVLGLMKAQMTKNSVIVPVGSKGGFVVNASKALLGREEYLKEGIRCYETFLKGLLDITDNIIDGKIVPPKDVIRLDDDDPYLVVAADKGTASFSDIANNIAAKYNFWLGDAFASGGSFGYDHKKMAITARGGWISISRHFKEMGVDITKNTFTVVGIGDMSGDVFGNAMLLSDNIRLIGAFNHLHIFIDPNPDNKTSIAERRRLFSIPGSSWGDYNLKLISEGGGVFDRRAKTINLSQQIKDLLEIEEDQISPDNLIKKLLMAQVDLLWNGGIGTYVKSSQESDAQVGDKANDNLRINGKDLRCKIVGEGGNLGFTQLGRIEYASKGGRINTDAIDNSAGVDCSDHEVNIKIALQSAISSKRITLQERNQLLFNMTNEVADLVLKDNIRQTQAITILQLQGNSILSMNARLINKLESIGLLDRAVEFLPSNEQIAELNHNKLGLSRPEISVLLSYSKINLYNDLISSGLPDEPYFENDLIDYFPKEMQKKFIQDIRAHRLRREIIATVLTNSIVNRVGTYFYQYVAEDTGAKASDIARAYTIVRDCLDLRNLWQEIEAQEIPISIKVEFFVLINKSLSYFMFKLLKNYQVSNISEMISSLKPFFEIFKDNIESILSGFAKSSYFSFVDNYKNLGVLDSLSKKVSTLCMLNPAVDFISISKNVNLDALEVAKIYCLVGERVKFDHIRYSLEKIQLDGYWQRVSLTFLSEELYEKQKSIVQKIINKYGYQDPISKWAEDTKEKLNKYDVFMNDLLNMKSINESVIMVALKKISELMI